MHFDPILLPEGDEYPGSLRVHAEGEGEGVEPAVSLRSRHGQDTTRLTCQLQGPRGKVPGAGDSGHQGVVNQGVQSVGGQVGTLRAPSQWVEGHRRVGWTEEEMEGVRYHVMSIKLIVGFNTFENKRVWFN